MPDALKLLKTCPPHQKNQQPKFNNSATTWDIRQHCLKNTRQSFGFTLVVVATDFCRFRCRQLPADQPVPLDCSRCSRAPAMAPVPSSWKVNDGSCQRRRSHLTLATHHRPPPIATHGEVVLAGSSVQQVKVSFPRTKTQRKGDGWWGGENQELC